MTEGNRPPGRPAPNILVIAMDTVRASDFIGAPGGVTAMPFAADLQRRSIVFPRAATTAPWTVPAHASIFTGMFPWEHGCHNRRSVKLDARLLRLPELLRPLGYRSLSLSSNFLLGPELGFAQGFDLAAWGGWWEVYFRISGSEEPPHRWETLRDAPPPTPHDRSGPLWSLVKGAAPLFHQYPAVMDGSSRLVWPIRNPGKSYDGRVSPWIEPTLSRWLRQQPAEKPVFVFVNLLEAHEPYFPQPATSTGAREYWRNAVVRQDRLGWLSGAFNPQPEDLRRLHELYRRSIESIDRRLRGIVGAFQESGRWENTALVLTSDHGQAFGEHGLFFHMLRVDEAEIRIPLWLRLPGDEMGGTTAEGWASLADIAPTALELAGEPYARFPSAVSLQSLVRSSRPEPLLVASDGITADPMLRGLSADRRAEFDQPWVGAYEGGWKLVLNPATDVVQAFEIDADPGETRDRWADTAGSLGPLAVQARQVAIRMTGQAREENSPEIEDRLRSWGYI